MLVGNTLVYFQLSLHLRSRWRWSGCLCDLICSIMRCMTPLGVKHHIKVRVRVRVGISESHYGAYQAIYKRLDQRLSPTNQPMSSVPDPLKQGDDFDEFLDHVSEQRRGSLTIEPATDCRCNREAPPVENERFNAICILRKKFAPGKGVW